MPFRSEFDAAGAFDVIEHLDDDVGALRALVEVVAPGGGLLLTVPQHPWLWSTEDIAAEHKRRYRRRELKRKVASAGIDVLLISSFVFAPLPALALRRLRRPAPDYDPVVEGSRGVPLASFLEGILSVEARAVTAGVSLPAGGSLVVVGRRAGA